jgi:hypothetical protein
MNDFDDYNLFPAGDLFRCVDTAPADPEDSRGSVVDGAGKVLCVCETSETADFVARSMNAAYAQWLNRVRPLKR